MEDEKLLPREEKLVKALAEEMAESLYYSVILAKGVAAIEDYKQNPDKYLANEKFVKYLEDIIRSK